MRLMIKRYFVLLPKVKHFEIYGIRFSNLILKIGDLHIWLLWIISYFLNFHGSFLADCSDWKWLIWELDFWFHNGFFVISCIAIVPWIRIPWHNFHIRLGTTLFKIVSMSRWIHIILLAIVTYRVSLINRIFIMASPFCQSNASRLKLYFSLDLVHIFVKLVIFL